MALASEAFCSSWCPHYVLFWPLSESAYVYEKVIKCNVVMLRCFDGFKSMSSLLLPLASDYYEMSSSGRLMLFRISFFHFLQTKKYFPLRTPKVVLKQLVFTKSKNDGLLKRMPLRTYYKKYWKIKGGGFKGLFWGKESKVQFLCKIAHTAASALHSYLPTSTIMV